MNSESENSKKLNDFFGREYRALKVYVNNRIRDTASRNAEDIIQDVALKLFSGADRYAPINNVAGFVYRSIRNKIIDIMRTTKPTEQIEIDSELLDLAEMIHQSTDDQVSEEMIPLLKKSIKQLKPGYRDIIIAVDFEGYSYKEISKETGIPEGTLMSRRHRAIGILYKKLESEINKHKN
ncbi:RNA polymerase sigma factor [Flavivirga sp. 57AJ16]|uniref:RNA polymerase sigma factor n=1 Tax=Flavivirga sp. 57AJ16 TaxID=3025307 RepID=UPI0023672A4F|nr:RNA polymerase sigma factor [Flavivirga sp. 57AJ16]MDD7887064.1 RNA polymerase sigma factor [Flavivirga sp. 57AJ16]